MIQQVRDVMTPDPLTTAADSTVVEAARLMRGADIGNVIVVRGQTICGILTDRDVVVRTVAEGANPDEVTVGEICSPELATVAPGESVEDAATVMREKALRRLPVVEQGKPVGIVTLGDLAILRAGWRRKVRSSSYLLEDADPASTLADISAAPPNT